MLSLLYITEYRSQLHFYKCPNEKEPACVQHQLLVLGSTGQSVSHDPNRPHLTMVPLKGYNAINKVNQLGTIR